MANLLSCCRRAAMADTNPSVQIEARLLRGLQQVLWTSSGRFGVCANIQKYLCAGPDTIARR
jgi:hypothetical protein